MVSFVPIVNVKSTVRHPESRQKRSYLVQRLELRV
jgi:hypothetical protein